MTFEYGSSDFAIRNPYFIEGRIRIAGGLLVAGMGVLSFLRVPDLVDDGGRQQATLQLLFAVLLSTAGLVLAGRGAVQVFRFYVGRNAPADLAPNLTKGEPQGPPGQATYKAKQIEEMLVGRKNITYRAPSKWLRHLAHTVFPQLLFLPPPYRAVADYVLKLILLVGTAAMAYGLLWFLGFSGILADSSAWVSDRAAVFFSGCLVMLLAALRLRPLKGLPLGDWKSSRLSLLIPLLTLPAIVFATMDLLSPSPLGVSFPRLFLALLVLLALTAALLGLLLRKRSEIGAYPPTEVSEFKAEWQESVHPRSLFTHLDSIVMKRRRHKEAPNRIYTDWDSGLMEEGSDNKGAFSGRIIQEVQPIQLEAAPDRNYDRLKALASGTGVLLFVLAAFLVYLLPGSLADTSATNVSAALLLYAVVLWVFGTTIVQIAHHFWCEILFDSLIVLLRCDGTYSESKVSVGKAILDSVSSENYIVRSSLTPLLIVARAVTSTFVGHGPRTFDTPRYLLAFGPAPEEAASILRELRNFLDSRSDIAPIRSNEDIQNISALMGLNRQASADRGLEPGDAATPEKLLRPSEVEEPDSPD